MSRQAISKGLSLGTKFSLLVIFILVVTLGLNTLKLINDQNRLFKEQLEQRGRLLGYFVSLISPDAILSYDYITLENMIREVTNQDDIIYAVVVNNKNQALTTYLDQNEVLISQATKDTGNGEILSVIESLNQNDNIINMQFPINLNQETIGRVLLGISKQKLVVQAGNMIRHQVLIGSLIIIFLVVCIYLVFRSNVLRSVHSLVQGYNDVMSGELNKPLPIRSSDEFGFLTDSFNEMVKRLQQTSQEKEQVLNKLNILNASLNAIVEEQVSELKSKEARLTAIFENITEGIVVIDEQGIIESVNRAGSEIFGVKREELVGTHFYLVLCDSFETIDEHKDSYDDEKNGPFSLSLIDKPIEYIAKRPPQESFPMEIVGTQMLLGERRYRICVIRDITQQKLTAHKLETIQQELVASAHKSGMAEIATGVLHNIGNILNSVIVSVESVKRVLGTENIKKLDKANRLLSDNLQNLDVFFSEDSKGKRLPDFYIKLGEQLKREYETLWDEMSSLDDKSKMMCEVINTQQEYAKAGFLLEAISIHLLIEDVIKLHMSSLVKSGIRVEHRIDELPSALGQKSKLLQVLSNLIINAKEALSDDDALQTERRITVTAVLIDDFIEISVSDTGHGISEENLDMIFSHGFTTKRDGHGFGLHMSANAMTEMQGSLSVHSEGKGRGAIFIVRIPVAKTSEYSLDKISLGV